MCSKKLCLITTVLIASTVVLFNGCGKNDTEPATSEAIEETEPTEEIEEIEEPDQGTNEGTAIDRETNTNSSENSGEISSIGGEDTKTDEEIEAELEEIENVEINEEGHRIVNGIDYDNDNNGQGWDIGGVHYDTWGEYLEVLNKAQESNPNNMTEEEWDSFMQSLYGN